MNVNELSEDVKNRENNLMSEMMKKIIGGKSPEDAKREVEVDYGTNESTPPPDVRTPQSRDEGFDDEIIKAKIFSYGLSVGDFGYLDNKLAMSGKTLNDIVEYIKRNPGVEIDEVIDTVCAVSNSTESNESEEYSNQSDESNRLPEEPNDTQEESSSSQEESSRLPEEHNSTSEESNGTSDEDNSLPESNGNQPEESSAFPEPNKSQPYSDNKRFDSSKTMTNGNNAMKPDTASVPKGNKSPISFEDEYKKRYGHFPLTPKEEADKYKKESMDEPAYFDSQESKKFLTKEDLDSVLSKWFSKNGTWGNSDEMARRKQEAMVSPRTNQDNKVFYSKGQIELGNGRILNYKSAVFGVDWKIDTNDPFSAVTSIENGLIDLIDEKIGLNRVTTLAIHDLSLIINGIEFRPMLKNINIEDLPWDIADYVKEGKMGYFFYWDFIKLMPNLSAIYIDDVNYFTSKVDQDLRCGGRIGVSTMFRVCRRLKSFSLNDETIMRDDLYGPKSRVVKERVARQHRIRKLTAGFKLNAVQNTQRFNDWTFDNMVNYATNRGDKGLFRYCGGVLSRAGLTAVATVFNFATHIVKGTKDVLTNGFTPIDEDEMYENSESVRLDNDTRGQAEEAFA